MKYSYIFARINSSKSVIGVFKDILSAWWQLVGKHLNYWMIILYIYFILSPDLKLFGFRMQSFIVRTELWCQRNWSFQGLDRLSSVAVGDLAGVGVEYGGCRHAARIADAVEQGVNQAPADIIVR